MLIFEITKTNTLLPQKGLAPILIAPPHTYIAYATQATISSVKQRKTNVTPCLHRTRAAWQNTIEVIIISDAVYTGCCAARKIPDRKLLPRSIYDVLTQISNDFQRSLYRVQCRQTLVVAVRRVRCRHGVTHLSGRKSNLGIRSQAFRSLSSLQRWKADPIFTRVLLLALSFRRRFALLVFIRHLYLSVARLMSVLFTERSLLHIMSRHAPYCWLATSLFWYSAQTQFSKAFLKNDIPHL